MRLHLANVQGKDKFDEPMHIMIGEDISNPTGKGIELWNNLNKFRNELTELVASSQISEKKPFFFKAPSITNFKDMKDLNAQIDKAIKSSNVSPDDQDMIKKIYGSLTKQERSEVHEVPNVHWIGKTFDHSPSVAAIASLSSLQKEVLTARADAIALIRSRVGGGEYSFNKIMPLAYGPEVANQNEEVEVQVLMAAFDSDKQPIVKVNGGTLRETKDGKGFVTAKGASGEIHLTGEITILNKSGIPKTLPWEKTIQIMKPQGTVSLPEMNVLYRGYDNKVQAVASGYPEAKVTGSGVNLVKSADGYIGKVNTSGREASISITGFNKQSNKSVPLGTFKFRVMNLPPPNIYFGGAADGEQASKAETRLFAKYGPEIPLNVSFQVLSWELNVAGAPRPAKGTGNSIAGEGSNLLKQAKPGSTISFMVQVKGPDGGIRKRSGVFRI